MFWRFRRIGLILIGKVVQLSAGVIHKVLFITRSKNGLNHELEKATCGTVYLALRLFIDTLSSLQKDPQ